MLLQQLLEVSARMAGGIDVIPPLCNTHSRTVELTCHQSHSTGSDTRLVLILIPEYANYFLPGNGDEESEPVAEWAVPYSEQ